VGFSKRRVNFDGFGGRRTGPCVIILRLADTIRSGDYVAFSQGCICQRERGILVDCLLKILEAFSYIVGRTFIPVISAAKV
jgi:hypothetical protein